MIKEISFGYEEGAPIVIKMVNDRMMSDDEYISDSPGCTQPYEFLQAAYVIAEQCGTDDVDCVLNIYEALKLMGEYHRVE